MISISKLSSIDAFNSIENQQNKTSVYRKFLFVKWKCFIYSSCMTCVKLSTLKICFHLVVTKQDRGFILNLPRWCESSNCCVKSHALKYFQNVIDSCLTVAPPVCNHALNLHWNALLLATTRSIAKLLHCKVSVKNAGCTAIQIRTIQIATIQILIKKMKGPQLKK